MSTAGQYLELAFVKANKIEVREDILANVFCHQESGVAIYTVLGIPSIKTSTYFKNVLRHLLEKDGTDLDETQKKQISQFGENCEVQGASIFTWSQPVFITKGLKRVAIFLLGIQGNFDNAYDPIYIMLSGFCTFMSSFVIYLADGTPEKYIKHIDIIAAEGMRHIKNPNTLIHQKILVLNENWDPQKIRYGMNDSNSYKKKLQKNLQNGLNRTFEAFKDFEFFFLPSKHHEKFDMFQENFFVVTFGCCNVVPKGREKLLTVQEIIDEVISYTDYMDHDEALKGSVQHILNLRQKNHTDEKKSKQKMVLALSKVQIRYPITDANKNTTDQKCHSDTKTNKAERPQLQTQLPINKYTTSLEGKAEKSHGFTKKMITTIKAVPEKIKAANNVDSSDKCKTENVTHKFHTASAEDITEINKDVTATYSAINPQQTFYPVPKEKYHIKKFLVQNYAGEVESDQPQPPYSIQPNINQTSSLPNNLKAEKIKKAASLESNRNTPSEGDGCVSQKSGFPIKANKKCHCNAESSIQNTNPDRSSSNLNQEPKMTKLITFPINVSSKYQYTIIINRDAIELAINQCIQQSVLQPSATGEKILAEVKLKLKLPEAEFSKTFKNYKPHINEAISAIIIYIANMKSVFIESCNVSSSKFVDLHNTNYEQALASLVNAGFLKKSVIEKIIEAKIIFQDFNDSNLSKKHYMILAAIEGLKNMFTEKMSTMTSSDEENLLTVDDQLKLCIFNSAENFCRNTLFQKLEEELNDKIGNFQTPTENKEIDILNDNNFNSDLCGQKMQGYVQTSKLYENDNSCQASAKTVSKSNTRFTDEHEKGYAQRSNFTYKSNNQLDINSPSSNAEFTRKEHSLDELSTLPRNKISSLAAQIEETIEPSTKEHNKPKIATQADKHEDTHYSVGIDLNGSEIIASHFKEGVIEEIFRLKEPCIGFDKEVVWVKDQSLNMSNVFKDSNQIPKIVSLKYLFKTASWKYISVNWDDKMKRFLVEELLSFILSLVKRASEKHIGCTVDVCAISVPSYFHDTEAQAVIDAAKISGFSKVHVIRDICSSVFGCCFFKNMSGSLPKMFIVLNIISENMHVGYYDLDQSWNPMALSGDNYILANKAFSPLFGKLSLIQKFKNTVNDISNLVKYTEVTNVLILGNQKNYRTISECTELKKFQFRKIQHPAVNNGVAFLASLIGGNPNAKDHWNQNCPSELTSEKKFDEFLNHLWSAPFTNEPSLKYGCPSSFREPNINEIQEKLKLYLPKENGNIEEQYT